MANEARPPAPVLASTPSTATDASLRPAWLSAMSPAELVDAVAWLQEDARYLYLQAGRYRDAGNRYVASLVQENAAHSAALSRTALAMASAFAA